jgi:hypothetical protein
MRNITFEGTETKLLENSLTSILMQKKISLKGTYQYTAGRNCSILSYSYASAYLPSITISYSHQYSHI